MTYGCHSPRDAQHGLLYWVLLAVAVLGFVVWFLFHSVVVPFLLTCFPSSGPGTARSDGPSLVHEQPPAAGLPDRRADSPGCAPRGPSFGAKP